MKALITIICLSAVFALGAKAQVDRGTQRATMTDLEIHATNATNAPMSFPQLVAITRGSVRQGIATSMTNAAEGIVRERLQGATNILRSGDAVTFSATLNKLEKITEQHSMNVHVTYAARPIGGILSIRVDLVPLFGGIGSASRPVLTREFAQAVDNIDDDVVSQTILSLTHDLASEYAAK